MDSFSLARLLQPLRQARIGVDGQMLAGLVDGEEAIEGKFCTKR